MDSERYSVGPCPIGRALSHLGDGWSLMIVRDASRGLTRFDQFRTSLGIAPNILTRRLGNLVEAGILARQRYSDKPPRDEYVLTRAGRDIVPVLIVLGTWGKAHGGTGDLTRLIDVELGHVVDPVVIDRVTGAEIGTRALRVDGPGEDMEGDRRPGSRDRSNGLLRGQNALRTVSTS